jgi:hypothetical protein
MEGLDSLSPVLGDTPEQLNAKCANWVDMIVVNGVAYSAQDVAVLVWDNEEQRRMKAAARQQRDKVLVELPELCANVVVDFAKALAEQVKLPKGHSQKVEYYKAAITHAIQFAEQYVNNIRNGGK